MAYLDEFLAGDRPPQERLHWFVRDVIELLREIVGSGAASLRDERYETKLRAWLEHLEEILPRLHDAVEGTEIPPDRLEAVGLAGRQLDARLHGYGEVRARMGEGFEAPLLERAARSINSLLGRLAHALPPTGEYRELKEYIERGARRYRPRPPRRRPARRRTRSLRGFNGWSWPTLVPQAR